MSRRPRALAAVLLATALLSSPAGAQQDRPLPITIRVLTYNIRHGEGRDGRIALARIAEVMKKVRPDLVALQEVDRGTERSGGVDQLAELASTMGMHAEFGQALEFEGGAYGVAVLSRWPLESPDNQALPSSEEREPRTALSVRLRLGDQGPRLRFTSTHLDSGRNSDRLAQARYLADLLQGGGAEPSVLAGDFNDRMGTDVLSPFEVHWSNAAVAFPEEPGRGRRRGPRGDHVLFHPAGSWRLVEAEVVDETEASDHRPILAVLEWVGRR
jgi:endonuclease/exonuclease/phosphatase family metal-dependent hydrolase